MSASPSGLRVLRSPEVLSRQVATDELLVLRCGVHQVVQLAGTALDLWKLIEMPTSVSTLTAELAALHECAPSAIDAKVNETLSFLEGVGLVEICR